MIFADLVCHSQLFESPPGVAEGACKRAMLWLTRRKMMSCGSGPGLFNKNYMRCELMCSDYSVADCSCGWCYCAWSICLWNRQMPGLQKICRTDAEALLPWRWGPLQHQD